ncbi:MAG: Ig-like domain-containing protein [Dysgonamonadaceae bacterium]|nr:Ig-like domain-containing protein [Dysgonamonadaceae bacterium]
MKKASNILLVLLTAILLTNCKESDTSAVLEIDPPVLLHSIPQNNAVNVPVGDISVRLEFDKIVFCPSAGHSKVSINDTGISSISVQSKEIIINIVGLQAEKTYTLTIPKGVILGPNQVETNEIKISFTTAAALEIAKNPVTENPSPEAVALYNYLRGSYGNKIIAGTVAQVAWNTVEAERVERWTGKFPKINVFDYIHLWASPTNWIDYGDISVIENWHNAGGIVGAMWHWNVPKSETAAGGDVTFRPEETTFRPANALVSGTWENTVMLADLGKMADYLLLLKNKNIPVLWRPLHEAAGNMYATGYKGAAWFWWGRDGAEAFKSLWIYMFNYFESKGLNNLIWIWTTEVTDSPFYPGNGYVDIVGRDLYNNASATATAAQFKQIQDLYPTKMITLAECGNVANIGEQWNAGARWAWFMPWYDYNAADSDILPHEHAGKQWWLNAVNQQFVVTR